MMRIKVYTDGSCYPNPGIGGYAYLIRYPSGKEIIGSGGEPNSTNNRMELMAVIKALEFLKDSSKFIELTLDSQYVGFGMKKWMHNWAKAGFKVKNGDLWEILYNLYKRKDIKVTLVRGHSDCIENNLCDSLANKARLNIKVD